MQKLPNKAKVLIFVLTALFISLFVYTSFSFKFILSKTEILLAIILSISILVSDRFPVIIPIGTEVSELSVSTSITFALAFLFNPFVSMTIVLVNSLLTELISKRIWYKVLFNTTNIVVSTGLISLFFWKYYSGLLPFTSLYNLSIIIFGAFLHFISETFFLYLLLSFIINRAEIT